MRPLKQTVKNENESQGRDRWLISYADLVTLLLALFIVLYAASDKERAKQIAESFSAQNTGGSGILPGSPSEKDEGSVDRKFLENPVLMQKTKMRQSKYGLVVSLSEAGFFASGDAAINAEAQGVIDAIVASLREGGAQVRIEGHTDSTPISTGRYPSNWELSTARASSVLARLIEQGIDPARLSAAGYAGFQPIADNSTAEGRAQNRRVDIVILDR
jgi:chemotaxis protein MotB